MKNFLKWIGFAILALTQTKLVSAQTSAQPLPLSSIANPFFLAGDGELSVKNVNNGRIATVKLVDENGKLVSDSFYKIDQVFGFPANEKKEHISLRTLFMLDYFTDQLAPGKTINMHSGYRSPQYNQNLRKRGRLAARTSTHMDGMAIDFSLPGVNGKAMWDFMRAKDCCGAGNYGGNIVHLDSGKPRFWEAATSKVGTDASAFNRFIYLSSEYDRYHAGDAIRFLYTSISDFGFGLKRTFTITKDKEGTEKVATAKLTTAGDQDCLMINEREDARFVQANLPVKLKPGLYYIKIDFCSKPFEEMPDERISNVIEILENTHDHK